MNCRYIILLTLLSSLLCMFDFSYSAKNDVLGNINQEISEYKKITYYNDTNKKDKLLNEKLLNGDWAAIHGSTQYHDKKPVVVYGSPFGELDRYLGQTYKGEEFTNFMRPHDAWNSKLTLEQRTWIPKPWDDDRTQTQAKEMMFNFPSTNIASRFLPNMIAGIETYYGDVINKKTGEYKNIQWQNYIHVLQPPTNFTWGMGRMWHETAGGDIYYITVPLVPNSRLNSTLVTHFVDEEGKPLADPAMESMTGTRQVEPSRTFKDYELVSWKVIGSPDSWGGVDLAKGTSASAAAAATSDSYDFFLAKLLAMKHYATGTKNPAGFDHKPGYKSTHLVFVYKSTKPMVTFTISQVDKNGKKITKDMVFKKSAPDTGKSIDTSIYIKPIPGYSPLSYTLNRTIREAGSVTKDLPAEVGSMTPAKDSPHDYIPSTRNLRIRYTSVDQHIRVTVVHSDRVDLILKDIQESINPEHKTVLISVTVANTSAFSKRGVPLLVEIPGEGKKWTDKVDLAPQSEQTFWYAWTTPSGTKRRVITAHINPPVASGNTVASGRTVEEVDYTNNQKQLSTKVNKNIFPFNYPEVEPMSRMEIPIAPTKKDVTRVDWTELRYSHTRHWTNADGSSGSEDVYVEKDFYATLSASIVATPNKMKSGYGFGLTVKTTLISNYDRPEDIIGPQTVEMTVPEHFYKDEFLVPLEAKKPLGSFENTFEFKRNPITPINAKRWYVPVWFPDLMDYTGYVVIKDCYTPGGPLVIHRKVPIAIDGNMYQDDWTTSVQ